ncbi:MAG: hypothetical protein J7L61_01375, partial [Thermoplasmata archaeon]|nr:hypothetical protein [Thermoplasmata archaeon]
MKVESRKPFILPDDGAFMDPGEIWKGVNRNQRFLGAVLLLALVASAVGGGYHLVYERNRITCLSCLSLQPVAGDFEGWWTTYPEGSPRAGQEVEHPAEVAEALGEYDVVMVFFWQTGCSGCEKQWKEMRESGLVTGNEANGRLDKYKEVAVLFSVDLTSGNPEYSKNIQWFYIYATAFHDISDPKDPPSVPLTVFVTHHEGEIGWYGYEGPMPAEDVDGILN